MSILVADKEVITGSLPAVLQYSDPVALGEFNAAVVQVVLLNVTGGGGIGASFVGCDAKEGNYLATGPSPIALSTAGEQKSLDLGTTGWPFIRVLVTAGAGTSVYSATLNLYKR